MNDELKVVCCRLYVVGCMLWVVGCGLWVVGCGLWDCLPARLVVIVVGYGL
jgi:hypothetical protein